MAVTLTHVGRRPGQSQYGLDTFTESFKANDAADVVLLDSSVPQRGDAHPDYQFMFVTDRNVTETGPSSSALDVVYMGCMKESDGSPVLPAGQKKLGNPVQTSTAPSGDGVNQVTVQFYSVLSQLDFITYINPASPGSAPSPVGNPTVITFTLGNTSFSSGEAELLSFFQLAETDIVDSTEIVQGKYWMNSEQRTRFYSANRIACHPFTTKAVCIQQPGSGYSVSDTLTCTDLSMNTAVMVVTAVGGAGDITDFSISSDDISAGLVLIISAVGGSGSGASFRFYGA